MAGKDVPDDIIKRVTQIQSRKMEEEKARLGFV